MCLTYNDEEALKTDWGWDGTSRPPQFDWYVSLVCAEALGAPIWVLEGLDMTDAWTRETVKGWALMRMDAEAQAQEIRAAAQG